MKQDIKELLELAAKACGYTLVDDDGLRGPWCNEAGCRWRPDLDDGDGARMEAELGLTVRWAANFVEVRDSVKGFLYACDIYTTPGDKNSGRRMASLRVAAEIGRRMKG